MAFNAQDSSTHTNVGFHIETDPQGSGDKLEVVATKPHGTYGEASGNTTGVIDVPATALITGISVINNATTSTTVQIGAGPVKTLPIGVDLDQDIVGDLVGQDITIGGGAPQFYLITWVV